MNAQELRIGNIVKAPILINGKTVIQEVVSIGVKYAQLKNLPDGFAEHIKYDEIEPIPLTEEWLLKCGFEKCGKNDFYENLHEIQVNGNKCFVELSEENGLVFVIGWGDYYDPHQEVGECLYVHELQNLYYALTKEELKFEL